jgi:hypothetical protein
MVVLLKRASVAREKETMARRKLHTRSGLAAPATWGRHWYGAVTKNLGLKKKTRVVSREKSLSVGAIRRILGRSQKLNPEDTQHLEVGWIDVRKKVDMPAVFDRTSSRYIFNDDIIVEYTLKDTPMTSKIDTVHDAQLADAFATAREANARLVRAIEDYDATVKVSDELRTRTQSILARYPR